MTWWAWLIVGMSVLPWFLIGFSGGYHVTQKRKTQERRQRARQRLEANLERELQNLIRNHREPSE